MTRAWVTIHTAGHTTAADPEVDPDDNSDGRDHPRPSAADDDLFDLDDPDFDPDDNLDPNWPTYD